MPQRSIALDTAAPPLEPLPKPLPQPLIRDRSMTSYVLTVACESKRGIVAAISGFLAEQGCNITDAAQYDDLETGRFFTRITFTAETGATPDALRDGFAPVAESFGMVWGIHDRSAVHLYAVSKFAVANVWPIGYLAIRNAHDVG